MGERFTKLFSLEKGLFCENSPYILLAGTLLLDNNIGKLFVQLRMKNVSVKIIKSAIVSIICFDTEKKPFPKTADYKYSDMHANWGDDFGTEILIPIEEADTRSFFPKMIEIIFTDDSIWKYSGEKYYYLPNPEPFSSVIDDYELQKQFILEHGDKSVFYPKQYSFLWLCSCGSPVLNTSDTCYNCGTSKNDLIPVNLEKLKENRDKRISEGKEESEREYEEKKITHKYEKVPPKKFAMILLIIMAISLATIVAISLMRLNQKSILYASAVDNMNNKNYSDAIVQLEKLGSYKDSEELLNSCKSSIEGNCSEELSSQDLEKKYMEAIAFIENEDSSDDIKAYIIFSEIKEYKDSLLYIEGFRNLPVKCRYNTESGESSDKNINYNYYGKVTKIENTTAQITDTYEYNDEGQLSFEHPENGSDAEYSYANGKCSYISRKISKYSGLVYRYCDTYINEKSEITKQEFKKKDVIVLARTFEYTRNDQGIIASVKWKTGGADTKNPIEGEITLPADDVMKIDLNMEMSSFGELAFNIYSRNKIDIFICNYNTNELDHHLEILLDDNGNIIEKTCHDEDNAAQYHVENVYDGNNLLSRKVLDESNNNCGEEVFVYDLVYAPFFNEKYQFLNFPTEVSHEGLLF